MARRSSWSHHKRNKKAQGAISGQNGGASPTGLNGLKLYHKPPPPIKHRELCQLLVPLLHEGAPILIGKVFMEIGIWLIVWYNSMSADQYSPSLPSSQTVASVGGERV